MSSPQPVPTPSPAPEVQPPSPTPWWKNAAVVGVVGMVGAVAAVLALFRDTIDFKIGQPDSPPSSTNIANASGSVCSDEFYGATTGWGPDRPTNGPSDWSLQPSFNVERENPNYGDERNFVIGKDASLGQSGSWTNDIEVVPGREYIIRILVHNGARNQQDYVARDTRVRLEVPSCAGRSVELRSVVEASNVYPREVWDGVVFRSPTPFKVVPVSGSADLSTNSFLSGVSLPDDLFDQGKGALIGSTELDGNVGGDYVNVGIVLARVVIRHA
ncbi:hypothetical protein ACFYO7_07520 [Nocardia salmonicida]|uniref:hypothetical protein n=1 Tax=Nocardia salmonicida TaxID=53431 RepID=UPI0036864A6A